MKAAVRHPALASLSVGLFCCFAAVGYGASLPPASEGRAQLGRIGVVSAHLVPEVEYRTPEKGGVEGAVSGAGKGLALGTLGAAGCFLSLGYAVSNCAVGLGTPIRMVLSAITQAGHGVPSAEVEAGEAAIRAALAGSNLEQTLRDRFLTMGRERTGRSLVLIPDQWRVAPGMAGTLPPMTSRGIDTVVELGIQSIRLELSNGSTVGVIGALNPAESDPRLTLTVSARARVVSAVDGSELSLHTARYRGGVRRYTDWVANNALDVRKELDRASQGLAADIVARLFGGSVHAASAASAL
jgi:hypothetical protein